MKRKFYRLRTTVGAISVLHLLLSSSAKSCAAPADLDLYAATGKTPPVVQEWTGEPILATHELDEELLFAAMPESIFPLKTTSKSEPVIRHDVEASNERILKTIIEMQRLNTLYRIKSTGQPKFRQYRQSMYVEVNASCTIAGTIDAMRLHYPNVHKPRKIFEIDAEKTASGQVREVLTTKTGAARRIRPALNQGIQEPQVVGNCINACGDVFELSSNAIRWHQLKAAGYDSKTFRIRLLALSQELDAELAQREKMESRLPAASRELEISQAEGRLQHDLRDLILKEYSQYHASAIRLHWFQNAAYLLDLAKNTAGGVGGIVSIEGSHLQRARIGGGAAVFTTISGGLILTIPFAGRVAGNWASTVDRHIVNTDYGHVMAQSTADAFRDRADLNHVIDQSRQSGESGDVNSDTNKNWDKRLYAYGQLCDMMKGHEVNVHRLVNRAKRATIENFVYAGATGSTKVALGVCGILSGWRYYDRPWIASRLQAAGNTAYTAGSGFSILENARVFYSQQKSKNQLSEQQLWPAQIYQARLNTLDDVERRFNTAELTH